MYEMSAARKALKESFGYDSFRPLQEKIIESVLSRRDTLVLMPTGGGKSLCFQIPALLSEGVCLVVSPLIALMKDQVESLRANGIGAAALNSSISPSEEDEIIFRCRSGEIKLLYVSPEKLVGSFGILRSLFPVSFFAIDEAHCISAWGHDFRLEYTQLGLIKEQMPDTPVIALTATADKVTRRDIVTQLRLRDPEIFISSFDRPNLSLEVRSGRDRRDKLREIESFLREREQESGIIYCLSRRETEEMAEDLRRMGVKAACYHAGLDNETRSKTQEDFINDRISVICATIAFGMGIDKPNVRFVIHNNLPKSIEGYFQEIGRAGRDGLPSATILYFNLRDIVLLTQFAGGSKQSEINLARLQRMQQYAEANICRRRILLNYFGESMEHDCGNCDVCLNPRTFFDASLLAQKALSALARTEEKVGVNMLIDVLRGSSRAELLEKGYQHLKTYGAGAEHSFNDWQQYILQLLHTGVMEIAYDENFTLKITPLGKEVLFGKKTLQLAQLTPRERPARKKEREKKAKEIAGKKQLTPDEALFQRLRALRSQIARAENVPPYIVFGDAALKEMAAMMPQTEEDMLNISGVGKRKMETYAPQFLQVIREFTGHTGEDDNDDWEATQHRERMNLQLQMEERKRELLERRREVFLNEQEKPKKREKGDTYKLTLELYQKDLSIADIARERSLNPGTVYSHLCRLYEHGEQIRLHDLISAAELQRIRETFEAQGRPAQLKPLFEAMNGEIDYNKLKLGLLALQKQGAVQ